MMPATAWEDWMTVRRRIVWLALASGISLSSASARAQEVVANWTLDSTSAVTLENAGVFALPRGSALRVRFGSPQPGGLVPVRIEPPDVVIPRVRLPNNQGYLRFAIARPAAGMARRDGSAGVVIDVQLHVRVTHEYTNGGTRDFALHLTTEKAESKVPSTNPMERAQGVRLEPASRALALVAVTRTGPDSVVGSDQAVLVRLSGSLDSVPAL